MDISNQIRQRREAMGLSQEELAQKVYVSRNTISNWENARTYPDLQSLLLLGTLFDTSLDVLVKGDVAVMEERLAESRRRFRRCAYAMAVGLGVVLILAIPLASLWGWAGLGVIMLVWVATFAVACYVERMKRRELDLVTYGEILAFMEGREVVRDPEARTAHGRRARRLREVGVAVGLAAIAFVVFYVLCAALDVPRW